MKKSIRVSTFSKIRVYFVSIPNSYVHYVIFNILWFVSIPTSYVHYLTFNILWFPLYNKRNRYFYVKLLLSRTLDFLCFCCTDITAGAQYAIFTCGRCPVEQWMILFIIQYLIFILVDNEVSHSVEITSWKRNLNFFTV